MEDGKKLSHEENGICQYSDSSLKLSECRVPLCPDGDPAKNGKCDTDCKCPDTMPAAVTGYSFVESTETTRHNTCSVKTECATGTVTKTLTVNWDEKKNWDGGKVNCQSECSVGDTVCCKQKKGETVPGPKECPKGLTMSGTGPDAKCSFDVDRKGCLDMNALMCGPTVLAYVLQYAEVMRQALSSKGLHNVNGAWVNADPKAKQCITNCATIMSRSAQFCSEPPSVRPKSCPKKTSSAPSAMSFELPAKPDMLTLCNDMYPSCENNNLGKIIAQLNDELQAGGLGGIDFSKTEAMAVEVPFAQLSCQQAYCHNVAKAGDGVVSVKQCFKNCQDKYNGHHEGAGRKVPGHQAGPGKKAGPGKSGRRLL